MKLSLVITNHDRTDMLFKSYRKVLGDDRISEIVIVDDYSRIDIYSQVVFEVSIYKKIRLIRNTENKGMQLNKAFAISQARNEWVIIFDSDNEIDTTYLDAFFNIHDLKENCIYMPEKALPKYDFSKHSGKYLDVHYIAENIKDSSLNVCMNTCNYIVNKKFYDKTFVENKNAKGSDTVYHALNHLKGGGIFFIVPGMEYQHATHDGSEYLKDLDYNMKFGSLVRTEIQGLNKKGMITCGLKGRFGNHLFIIATVIAHANRNGMPYHIPKDLYFDNLENPLFNPSLKTRKIPEHEHSYVPLPRPHVYENQHLTGHYQTEKYFKDYRDLIIKTIGVKPVQNNFIAIHVRRGDYLTMPTKFPPVTLDYIKDGIIHFINRGFRNFMVFGDDYEWNEENVKYPGCEFVYQNGTLWEDFNMMCGCMGHIISNSTFSWWAAWIADREVVAPKVWFGPGIKHLDTKDVIPDRWKKL